jgi:tetratricopeptide (TPR) repeat protein
MSRIRQLPRYWQRLPYGLSVMGLLVILLTGINLWVQQHRASSVIDASFQLTNVDDQRVAPSKSRLLSDVAGPEDYLKTGTSYLREARETGDPSYYYRAEDSLNQALAMETRSDWYRPRAMTGLGAAALGRHEFQQALELAQRSLEMDPAYASAYGVMGDAQLELGQYDNAGTSFQAMVDLKPDLGSYARVARLRELRGDTAGAIEAMQLAVAAGPFKSEATAWAKVQLGNLYFSSGRLNDAVEQYQAALREFDGYYLALASLGRVITRKPSSFWSKRLR